MDANDVPRRAANRLRVDNPLAIHADFASDEPLELRKGLVAADEGDEQRPHIARLADQRSPHDDGQEPKNSPRWDTSYFFTADTKPRSAIVSSYAPTSKSSFARIAPYSAGE